jgi:hypothetical protein
MAVQHADLHGGSDPLRLARGKGIAPGRLARHRDAGNAELEIALEAPQKVLRQRIAGRRIAQQAHRMAAPRLLAGNIAHVAEEAADRRPETVQDAMTRHGADLVQEQRP